MGGLNYAEHHAMSGLKQNVFNIMGGLKRIGFSTCVWTKTRRL